MVLTPVAIMVGCARHPPSPYLRDTVWCSVHFWLVAVLTMLGSIQVYTWEGDKEAGIRRQRWWRNGNPFWTASFNFEGVVFTWVARLIGRHSND